ncbi:phosphoglucosamine mutase [Selenomonas sp. TAMA-11512]|uniref:phosphoglucosamine mutase n=1 Tax=Selenomonas sp. TAMA-11512 TaxID=3095337 RepID=UPI003087A1D6|nr:phosphoglucosamine mutase [Selenomonas sp. TAMA-11512]
MTRLFGTDGVRGEANTDLTPELAYRLGWAAALYFGRDKNEPPMIYIGRDTRLSGKLFEAALATGICSAGGRCEIIGTCPTPAIAYLTKQQDADAGIVISASHNPFQDNGIKFFGADGYKLPDAVEDEIEALVRRLEAGEKLPRATGRRIGDITGRREYLVRYINYVAGTTTERFDGMKIVLDCANGAASEAMPKVLAKLGADVTVIHATPNGVNINENCGSTHLESLIDTVKKLGADIGIAHDGDADRCLCVDENGAVIDGDRILVMCAQDMIKEGSLKDNTVVTTVMANIGFHKAIEAAGAKTVVTGVGDRYVLENMLANGYNLGGEQSGHIIFKDFATTGDGLITAVQVLTSLKRSGKKASDLAGLMKSYPQLLVNVRVKSKDGWEDNVDIREAVEKGEEQLGKDGRILVRASGTEPLIRVMAEGPHQVELETICRTIADRIKQVQG